MRPLPRFILLLLPLALLLAALLDTPYHALWTGELYGVVRKAVAPTFSVEAFWNGRYQVDFEAWLEQQLAPKALMVRTDNTLNLVAFHEISAYTGIPIVLGKDHTLFEMNYVNNLNAVSELRGDPPPKTPLSVQETARLMGRVARAFKYLRMDFMIVFYPVKAVILEDRVPASFRLPGGQEQQAAGYANLLRHLRAEGVPVVDGAATFRKIARRDRHFSLYNSGGTHWADAGACEVAKDVLSTMTHANSNGAVLHCRHGKREPAEGVDMDLASLINVWDSSRFEDQLLSVHPVASPPIQGGPRDVWVVGTSYSDHLLRLLRKAGIFRAVKQTNYYRRSDGATMDWAHALSTHSVVILEQWEWSYLTVNLTEFVQDMAAQAPRFGAALLAVDAEEAAAAGVPGATPPAP